MKPLAALIYLPTLESPGGIHFTTDMQNTPDQLCDVLVWLRKPTWQERNAGISSWLQQGCQVNAYDTAEEITQRTAQRAAEDLAITQKQREIAAEERRQRMLHLVEKADAEGTELADERQLERTRETRAQEDRAIAAFVGNTTEQLSQLGSCSAEAALPTNNDAFVWMDSTISYAQMVAWVAQAIPTFRRVTGLNPNVIWMNRKLYQEDGLRWDGYQCQQDMELACRRFCELDFNLVGAPPGPEMMRLAYQQPNGARIIAQPATPPKRPRARDILEMGWNLEVRLERGQLYGYAWCISGGCKNMTPEFVCTVKETDDAPGQLLTAILGAIRSAPPADQIQAIEQDDGNIAVKAESLPTWEYGQPVWFIHPSTSIRTPGYVMAVFNHRAVVEDEDGKREACETACLEPRPNKSHEPAGPFFQ